jgi:hypothetical protein
MFLLIKSVTDFLFFFSWVLQYLCRQLLQKWSQLLFCKEGAVVTLTSKWRPTCSFVQRPWDSKTILVYYLPLSPSDDGWRILTLGGTAEQNSPVFNLWWNMQWKSKDSKRVIVSEGGRIERWIMIVEKSVVWIVRSASKVQTWCEKYVLVSTLLPVWSPCQWCDFN